VFAYDGAGNYSQGVSAQITPQQAGQTDIRFGNVDDNGDGIPDGYSKLDSGYGETGHDLAVLSNDDVVIAAETGNGSTNTIAVWKVDNAGALDAGFGSGGYVSQDPGSIDKGHGIAVDSQGRLLVAAYVNGTNAQAGVYRFLADGTLDTTFSTNDGSSAGRHLLGSGFDDNARDVVVDGQGRIIATGTLYGTSDLDIFVLGLDGNGDILVNDFGTDQDSNFFPDGYFQQHSTAGGGGGDVGRRIVLDDQGRILVAGFSYASGSSSKAAVVWRLNSDGTLDSSFDGDGYAILDPTGNAEEFHDLALDSQGRIVAAGYSQQDAMVARFNAGGSLDTSFGGSGYVTTGDGTNPAEWANGVAVVT